MPKAGAKKTAKKNNYLATISDYKKTFGSPEGRRVLFHLMKVHGVMLTSHVEGDPYSTAFNEGGRNVVIQILRKMRMDLKEMEKLIEQESEMEEDDEW